MNERRDETTIPVAMEYDKKKDEIEKKLNSLFEADKAAEEQLYQVQQILAIQGAVLETASESSLRILAIQYFITSLLTMFILQLNRFGWILTWLPFLEQFVGTIYIITLLLAEFCPSAVSKLPYNFLIFICHSCSKILLLVFISLWYSEYKCELITLALGISVLYLIYLIKSSVGIFNHEIQAEKQYQGMKVKKQFCNTFVMVAFISGVLCLLTRSHLIIVAVLACFGLIYICFLQLALQRFEQMEFIFENSNDIYLGPAILDADLLFFCKLCFFHCFSKKNNSNPKIKEEESDQNED
ncbi:unnamed protein product (macronuclear) [Paramecium tetraurelia]|uniref:Transmembrane protein n=1 Tax=Paramecium tetraurelia TaxID=5888 RepID=A0DIJ9_PARTE|nr:uncharacterized protein GSPATT00017223001 [Paramecium tetraurelia]CAK82866.1 unnamed protein product [Paramecium tetraurelia]|eukprot:XP_001450263.1 hypothetical protein (macronuclear) [Paramecium tetraurelia strain d4-2]